MTRQVKLNRADSDLLAFIDPEVVDAALAKCGNQFVSVTFAKNNGELRTYTGQLRSTSRLVGSDRGKAQGEAMKARGQVWLSLPQGGSKSFYKDRVIGLKAGGEVYGQAAL